MSSIRGLLVTEYTDFNNLEINEIPRVNLGPKQVRIRVKAAGVSFSTKLVVEGKYQRKPPLPFTPGTECAGEIIEVKPASGTSVMLPFAGESVVLVDIQNRQVVLAPPVGLLDDDTKDQDRADQNDG